MSFPSSLHKQAFKHGEVALVGTGPGDPELLTIQAFNFIKQADIVIFDRLVSPEIMALVPEFCEKIYVGKKQAKHKIPQDGINQLLVDHAKLGKKVVRLKGGDPFVFGRGSEEAQYALKNGIACHIVPGMTAASACSSYVGIPLTHREVARSASLVTGHVKDCGELDLPWHTLSDPKQTVVFYMGVKSLPTICEQLIAAGRDKNTPAAVIYKGTTPEQKLYRGCLISLPELVEKHQVKPPSLIIIGGVVETFDEKQLTNLGYLSPIKK
ncbi:uroporphyrinogen-III C-methyltransferase [Thalassotalea ganghwensis]